MTADTPKLSVSDGEIAVLRAALDVLKGMSRGYYADTDSVRVQTVADRAADGVFAVLNWTNSHIRTLTHEQLHGRPEPEPEPAEPQSIRA